MKKSDVMLVVILVILNTVFLFRVIDFSKSTTANVYYDNQLIMELDLKEDGVYKLDGVNGEVEITVKDGKVAITKETSPLNICSKQGYVDVGNVPLICLPNKVVVEGTSSEVDGVAK
ncbi:MAG: NusG domain II-containing protein [Bacilli bacterium]